MPFEQLRVYQAAQELRHEVDRLGRELDLRFQRLFDHLDDAVDSISNNIAEGAESVYPAKRKAYYDIAGGSSKEARSALRRLAREQAFCGASPFRAIVLSLAVAKMLRALIEALEREPGPPAPDPPSSEADAFRRRPS